MSSLMGSHGVALATATAMAVSGTMIIVALRRQQQRPITVGRCGLRPCISSAGTRKGDSQKKRKKRVRFGEDVIVEFVDDQGLSAEVEEFVADGCEIEIVRSVDRRRSQMPANRAALYGGIMQDRRQRMACC